MSMSTAALIRLLQLCSPSLPVGAYSYSQGLEAAMVQGLVHDEASARLWLIDMLDNIITRFEAPMCWRLMQAFSSGDTITIHDLNDCFLAARDTAEFRAETVQMGYSLSKLLQELTPERKDITQIISSLPEVAFPTAFAAACAALHIPSDEALIGLLFSWAENQVIACVKSVPLGQVSGQRLLLSLEPALAAASLTARGLKDDELSNWSPGLSLLSMQHEVQYSRLYRS
jgi:urease accessory protein